MGYFKLVGNRCYIASILPSMEAKVEYEANYDLFLHNVELGGGYAITDKITIALGWKYQLFDFDKIEIEDQTVRGLTIMANFNF